MKLLFTSAGIKNASIRDALVDLLGKPISECSAVCIPTAIYGSVYAPLIADQTAMKVVDGSVEVVSEGHRKLFTPGRTRP